MSRDVDYNNEELTVLLVDDNESCRKFMQFLVPRAIPNIKYLLCEDSGLSGLRIGSDFRVHLIIFDGDMPGMNGPEMYKRLCEFYREENVEIPKGILVSGNGIEYGTLVPDDVPVLQKPFKYNEFVDALRSIDIL